METAIILSAGKGTRIYPFSETMPKAFLPLGDKSVIEYQIEVLEKLGFKQIIIVVGHLKEQIYFALKRHKNVTFIEDKKIIGTATSLLKVFDSGLELSDKFLVLYGDVVTTEETIKRIIDEARRGEDYVALTVPLNGEKPNDWICSKNEGDEIKYILAHARHKVTHRLGGVYVLNSGFKRYLEANPGFMLHVPVGVMPPRESYLEESIAMAIDDGETFRAVEPEGFFVDIDKPWHIIEANMRYLDYFFSKLNKSIIEEGVDISEDAEIHGKIVAKNGAKIKKGAEIRGDALICKNVIIGKCILNDKVSINDGSIVDEYCRIESHTVIGRNVRILHAAEVGGVIMDGVSIIHYSEVYGVIGRYTDIGAATVVGTLKFDDSPALIRIKGRKELPPRYGNGAYIGDFCRTGVNAIIMPGIRVGPYSAIGPGVILYEDLPPKTLVLAKQELIKKEWGPEKYGW